MPTISMEDKNVILDFLGWLSIAHSPDTCESYKWALRSFEIWLNGNCKEILQLQQKDFVDYGIYLKETRKVNTGTQAIYFTAIRSLWKWLFKQNLVKFSYDLIPSPKSATDNHYDYLSDQEYNLIINSFDEFYPKDLRDKTIISFLFATGVRLGEMLSIDIFDIDTEKMKGIVKTKKRKNHHREIYWGIETNNLLKKWLEIREKLLERDSIINNSLWINMAPQQFGKRLQKCAVENIFRKKRNELKIEKKITPHSCRHGFGYKALANNVHIRYAQEMLGHAKISTTQIYMRAENKDCEKIYREKMLLTT